MRDITEFRKERIVGTRMAGASVTKTAELSNHIKKYEKPLATGVIPARLPNLPTESDVLRTHCGQGAGLLLSE